MTPAFDANGVQIYLGDCRDVLRQLPSESVHCCVTSPPYWGLRDYGVPPSIWPSPQSRGVVRCSNGNHLFGEQWCELCGAWRWTFGLEPTPQLYVQHANEIFGELRRVLRSDGILWLNLGDSYATGAGSGQSMGGDCFGKENQVIDADSYPRCQPNRLPLPGLKPKDLIGVPWRCALDLQADGWFLRSEIIWAKPNGMPGSQIDRCTSSHETIFQMSKSELYWSDFDAIKTPPRESTMVRLAQNVQAQAGSHRANGGAKSNGTMKAVARRSDKQRGHSRKHAGFNDRWDAMEKTEQQSQPAMMRDVWFVAPATFDEAHFAVMPKEIARRCILAGCPEGGTVLDPFMGSGTTGLVARSLHSKAIGIELNPAYIEIAAKRLQQEVLEFVP